MKSGGVCAVCGKVKAVGLTAGPAYRQRLLEGLTIVSRIYGGSDAYAAEEAEA